MIRRTSGGRLRREADDAIGIGPCVKPGRTVQVARLWMGWDGMEWYGMVYGLRLVWVFEIWREGDSFVCTHDLSINLSPGETIASTLSLGPAAILCCSYMYGECCIPSAPNYHVGQECRPRRWFSSVLESIACYM